MSRVPSFIFTIGLVTAWSGLCMHFGIETWVSVAGGIAIGIFGSEIL